MVDGVESLERRRRADERSLVELDHARRRRRPWRRDGGRRVDEGLHVAVLERGVRPLLVADRRRVGGAHRRAAERAGDVSGIHLVGVGKLGESLQRVKEAFCPFARLDREVGTRGVADEEGVAGEDEPLVDDEGAVLGPVARCMDHAQRHRSDSQHPGRPRADRTGTPAPRAGERKPAHRARARSGRAPRHGRHACASRAPARSRRPRPSAASRYCSIAYAGSTRKACPSLGSPIR